MAENCAFANAFQDGASGSDRSWANRLAFPENQGIRLGKALTAIGALAQRRINAFRIATGPPRSVAQVAFADRIADADIHGGLFSGGVAMC